MVYTLCGLSIGWLILSILKYRTIYNPYTVFNALWVFVSIFLVVGNEYVYSPSNTALIASTLGLVAFNLSSLSPRLVLGKHCKHTLTEYELNQRTLIVLGAVVLVLSIVTAADTISQLLSGGDFNSVRDDYYTYSSNGSTLMYYFRQYFILPLQQVVIVGTIISLFSMRKKSKALICCALAILLLQAVASGGRYILLKTFFMLFCGFFMFGASKRISTKQKLLLVGISLALVCGIIYLTNERTPYLARNMNLWEKLYFTVYQYFAGSVTYFGQVIETYPFVVSSTYGLNFLAGFITPIFAFLTYVNVLPYPSAFSIIGTYACAVLPIGPGSFYNAMPTMFCYSYIDGGFILVFIEAWLFGYVCKRFYEGAMKGSLLRAAWYILIFTQICASSQRWFFYSSEFCLAFLYMRAIMTPKTRTGKLEVA